jgi:hypothetical protein
MKISAFWEGALIMEAVNTFETSLSFYEAALRNIPDDSYV